MTQHPATLRIGVNTLFLIPGEVGGSETYLRETLAALQPLAGVELLLFTNTENHDSFAGTLALHPNVALHRIKCRAMNRTERILVEQTRLPRALAKAHIDVLWNPGYTAPIHGSVPMVTSILDMQYKHYPEDLSLIARLTTDLLVRNAAQRSRAIITISEYARQDIARFTTANPTNIHVTHLAVDPAFAPPEGASMSTGNDAIRAPFLLCVANSYPHKNLPALVDAFGQVADAHAPNHQLVLLGHPRRGEEALQQAIAALPPTTRSRIVRPGRLSRDALTTLYRTADLFVFPSLYEGFGLPVLEAMMAHTRVVTTRCASIPEVAGAHAITATTPSAEGLATALRQALAETPAAREAACSAATDWARTFTWETTARQTLDVFRASISH